MKTQANRAFRDLLYSSATRPPGFLDLIKTKSVHPRTSCTTLFKTVFSVEITSAWYYISTSRTS